MTTDSSIAPIPPAFLPALPEILVPAGSRPGRQSNLAFALRKLPPLLRRDMLIFYQFCRVLDDLADDEELPQPVRESGLQAWKEACLHPEKLPRDLAGVFQRHSIPSSWLLEIIEGVQSDLTPQSFPDFAALRIYCHQVAVAVGLVSNQITGCQSPAATLFAENLGLALQLTNILRDAREDALRGRCYFPLDELTAANLAPTDFTQSTTPPQMRQFFATQGDRARKFFAAATAALPNEDRAALSAACAMQAIYQALLQKMEVRRWALLEERISLPLWQKLWCLLCS